MPQTITKRSEPCTTCGGVVITIERQPMPGLLKSSSLKKSTAWSCHADHASPMDTIDGDCRHHRG
ncbi:MAG: hypothetical protein ACTHMS_22190 [Jatrophihabitans sp.]|uniref:hypothetical protein n=1 Tax=Jatrophihabitans sp. TaxID=1932789 RepID=UPI003F7DCD5C